MLLSVPKFRKKDSIFMGSARYSTIGISLGRYQPTHATESWEMKKRDRTPVPPRTKERGQHGSGEDREALGRSQSFCQLVGWKTSALIPTWLGTGC